ncbi:MAG: hypothetical protein RLY58_1595 [Pseudomonadota bacterium]|jgi:hypothetical protein
MYGRLLDSKNIAAIHERPFALTPYRDYTVSHFFQHLHGLP